MVWGKGVADVLREIGILPDFVCEGNNFDFIHRSTGDADIYFVTNNNDEGAKAARTFRVSGK